MSKTLFVDLEERIMNSPRFNAFSLRAYWAKSSLRWWKPEGKEYREQERCVRAWLSQEHYKSVLEIGPGFGRITKIIKPRASRLVLSEINKKAIAHLGKKFKGAEIEDGTFSELDFPDKTFDLIAAIEILPHIPNIITFVEKVSWLLKPGGTFIASITPLAWYEKNRIRNPIIHRGIAEREFEELCRDCGFDEYSSCKSVNGHLTTYLFKKDY